MLCSNIYDPVHDCNKKKTLSTICHNVHSRDEVDTQKICITFNNTKCLK